MVRGGCVLTQGKFRVGGMCLFMEVRVQQRHTGEAGDDQKVNAAA
jgi:hypothetical protein